jgi:EARP and GARP complex-interacting protein 1
MQKFFFFFGVGTKKARAICSQEGESEIKRFLIGTQSLKQSNQVHLIEYDDETNSLVKCIFGHKEGEIWHIASSPNDKQQLLTCYNKSKQLNKY